MAVGISLPIFSSMLRASTETLSSWFRPSPAATPPAAAVPAVPVTPSEPEPPSTPELVMGISGFVLTDAASESAPEAARETLDIENDALRHRLEDAEIAHTATRYRLHATLEVLEVVSAKLARAQSEALEQAETIRALTARRPGRGVLTALWRVVGAPARSWTCRL